MARDTTGPTGLGNWLLRTSRTISDSAYFCRPSARAFIAASHGRSVASTQLGNRRGRLRSIETSRRCLRLSRRRRWTKAHVAYACAAFHTSADLFRHTKYWSIAHDSTFSVRQPAVRARSVVPRPRWCDRRVRRSGASMNCGSGLAAGCVSRSLGTLPRRWRVSPLAGTTSRRDSPGRGRGSGVC